MMQLTESELRGMVAEAQAKSPEPLMDEAIRFLGAAKILSHFLGRDWVKQEVFSASGDFLRVQGDAGLATHRASNRVMRLAEMLFNFQHIEGFRGRLRRILTEKLESAVAELRCAQLLYESDIPFGFVDESGTMGLDYDMAAKLGSFMVACEGKCKIEGKELAANNVRNALNKAREQLPTDRPAIVFVGIPESWSSNPALKDELSSAMAKVFKRTGRISAVIFLFEKWFASSSDEQAVYYTTSSTIHNENARFSLVEFGTIIREPRRDWKSIPTLLNHSVISLSVVRYGRKPLESIFPEIQFGPLSFS